MLPSSGLKEEFLNRRLYKKPHPRPRHYCQHDPTKFHRRPTNLGQFFNPEDGNSMSLNAETSVSTHIILRCHSVGDYNRTELILPQLPTYAAFCASVLSRLHLIQLFPTRSCATIWRHCNLKNTDLKQNSHFFFKSVILDFLVFLSLYAQDLCKLYNSWYAAVSWRYVRRLHKSTHRWASVVCCTTL